MSPAKPNPKPQLPIFWIALGALVVVVVGAIVFASIGKDDTKKSKVTSGGTATTKEFGTVTVTGDALATFKSGKDTADGTNIPTVSGENFAGTPVVIEPDGKAQMIVFLAHWCPHCNAEAPRLADFLTQNGGVPDGTDLVIVPTGSNADSPNWPPSAWVKTMGLGSVTTLVDDKDGTAARAFGLSSYPFIVLVGADGTVIERRAGEQANGFFAQAFDALAKGQTIAD